MMIHQQTQTAIFEPKHAIRTPPSLPHAPADRPMAVQVLLFYPGMIDEMSLLSLSLLRSFHKVPSLPPMSDEVFEERLAPTRGTVLATGSATRM
jgi:hypothetical protein